MKPVLIKPVAALSFSLVAVAVIAQQSSGGSSAPVAGSVQLGADVHQLELIAEG